MGEQFRQQSHVGMITGETGGPPVVSQETFDYPGIAQLCSLWAANFSKGDYGDFLRFTTVTTVKTLDVQQPDRSHTTGVTLTKQIDSFGDGGFYIVSNNSGVRHVRRHPARPGTLVCDEDEMFMPIAFSTPRTIIFFTTHIRYGALSRASMDVLMNLGFGLNRLNTASRRQGLCEEDTLISSIHYKLGTWILQDAPVLFFRFVT